ncbi:hypothetical protein BDY21DRAFT_381533 [Lineolata rhizophorae]|uniref:DUF2264 domain-containing protein n=1 Tax=Lineolata rhizophorae TaxID=578093 RepID=A0A6A6NRN0_9PEZI|nr:hypothetical protein BDY21DRAFT_381533 [Lineolata rhizophorae]
MPYAAAAANLAAPAHPFCTNPLRTRADVAAAVTSLLEPLAAGTSAGGALVRAGGTGARFDETAAQVEGFARPLWGLAALLAGGGAYAGAARWARGLVAGTDPDGPEFWGAMEDRDQRMVEACPIGFALAVAGDAFWEPLGERERANLAAWLGGMNVRDMPNTNWLWFRVFANLGLARNGAPYSQERLDADLDHLDTFYRGNGWSNDGPPTHTQMDYYSGSFAIQYLQLLYSKLAEKTDPKRSEEYKARARAYALDCVHYFSPEGSAVTFGRSLTYRWAMAGFWAGVAFAEVDLPAPLDSWGVVKGIWLRHLRWWTQHPFVFQPNGMLSIGFAYPNMYMTENYNSPGSPYWCMLAFAPLALPADHPFWTAPEEPYPVAAVPPVKALTMPLHVAVRAAGHTYILNSGQACHYPLRATQAKYGKFAYSSAFPYSVQTGSHTLPEWAPESTMALAEVEADAPPADGGGGGLLGELWKLRRRVEHARIETPPSPDGAAAAAGPVLVSSMRPWKDVIVDTWLIPPTPGSPADAWHLRVHRVRAGRAVRVAEGGFAVRGVQAGDGKALQSIGYEAAAAGGAVEGCVEGPGSALVLGASGAVGVVDVAAPRAAWKAAATRDGAALQADANSNLLEPRSVIPLLTGSVAEGSVGWFVTGVFAVPAAGVPGWRAVWKEKWEARPEVPGWMAAIMEKSG